MDSIILSNKQLDGMSCTHSSDFHPLPGLKKVLFRLDPKIIYVALAATIISFTSNSLFHSQHLLIPPYGTITIPFTVLSLLTMITGLAIRHYDTSLHPFVRIVSVIEGSVLFLWPMAPAAYFTGPNDQWSSVWHLLVDVLGAQTTVLYLLLCMGCSAVLYLVFTSPFYSEAEEEEERESYRRAAIKAAWKAARDTAREEAREVSADGISLHKNAASDEEQFFG
ncbi:hypothetical protein CGLO_10999 [Colletotrichum gloeosporioides Cg-14]|uniref:Uncharacterized protein n=1 Tax=Colletotrichum gloeosporioides (strain Cg-14) TaxID=1237896 RepID=T0LN26_COLGC|nr:hypothetical protein CGLO_10999 [Colletotrichum gloeosporioides Cg-14]